MDIAFIFGYRMIDSQTPVLTFDADQIYYPSELVASEYENGKDWAIVRLDRPVRDHKPLPIRRKGKIADDQSLVVIGHPSGLPAKVAGGARVRNNSFDSYFVANLDAYGGNSGSPVFNADTLVVEGVLVRGVADFIEEGDCYVSNRCSDEGCFGESATRTTLFGEFVPPNPDTRLFRVFLGRCGDLKFVGETKEATWDPGELEPATTYCWLIVAQDECGTTSSPIWTFTTEPAAGQVSFRRGDTNADGTLDISDPVSILSYLFLDGTDPSCLKSADTDDNGDLELADVISLLRFLFLNGQPPAEPAPACGRDLTTDTLSCQEYRPCNPVPRPVETRK